MNKSPTVNIDPDDYARYLLYQQFYYGDDLIFNRSKSLNEHIPVSGEAINKIIVPTARCRGVALIATFGVTEAWIEENLWALQAWLVQPVF